MFAWIRSRIRDAVVGGLFDGLKDTGLIESEAADANTQVEAIRAEFPAIADKPKREKKS